MQINRDNYENFFLLYVDGELCAADRKAVEEFAAAHADMQQDLNMLKGTVLPVDEMLMEEKGELYRPVPIDAFLQEKLLFKIDNELPENAMITLNELITNDVNVQAKFNLLQRTKLDAAERIVFADKQSLYRKERDKVVIGRFARWAAAAVLIGFGLFFGASLLYKARTPGAVAVNDIPSGKKQLINTGTTTSPQKQTSAHPAQGDQQVDPQNIASLQTSMKTQQNAAIVSGKPDNSTAKNAAVNNNSEKHPAANIDPILPKDNNAFAQQTPPLTNNINNLPVPLKENEKPSTLIASATPPNKIAVTDNNIVPLEKGYAQAVILNENDKSENKILYMDEDDVKRSKAGGLFRKVKRFVERTAKIKTGNTLRIAGFEIAAK